MTCDIHPGGIYKIPFPFTDLSRAKSRPALALSSPDSHGDVRFAFITTTPPQTMEGSLELERRHYEGEALPFRSFLRIERLFLMNAGIVVKELARLSRQAMADIWRKMILMEIPGFYPFAHASEPFIPGKSRIPYARRVFDDQEVSALVDASLDFWLTAGRYAETFEKELAEFLGVRYCSLVNSGSSANLLAFMALTSPSLGDRRIRKGDEVITLAAGFPTTVAPIIQFGAVPVFVDVELATGNIDCAQLEAAISPKTRAVMLAHTLGNPFDVKRVTDFCSRHGLWLIEDNCDALGARYQLNGQWQYTGSFGDLGTSSFYPPHHITMGEGGAVYTNNTTLKRLVESFRDWGRDCWCPPGRDNTCGQRFDQQFGELPLGYDHKYVYSHFGYNLKATDMQAAVGCAQLEKLPEFIEARRRNWQLLCRRTCRPCGGVHPPRTIAQLRPSWFGFLLTPRRETGLSRDRIVTHLESQGIQTRMLFAGNLIKHPCFDELRETRLGYRIVGELTNTDTIMNHSFWLGVYPGLTEVMIAYMVEQIREFVKGEG